MNDSKKSKTKPYPTYYVAKRGELLHLYAANITHMVCGNHNFQYGLALLAKSYSTLLN